MYTKYQHRTPRMLNSGVAALLTAFCRPLILAASSGESCGWTPRCLARCSWISAAFITLMLLRTVSLYLCSDWSEGVLTTCSLSAMCSKITAYTSCSHRQQHNTWAQRAMPLISESSIQWNRRQILICAAVHAAGLVADARLYRIGDCTPVEVDGGGDMSGSGLDMRLQVHTVVAGPEQQLEVLHRLLFRSASIELGEVVLREVESEEAGARSVNLAAFESTCLDQIKLAIERPRLQGAGTPTRHRSGCIAGRLLSERSAS
jgi:hypothetical protein